MTDINIENIGINTEYCSDLNGNDEFKCECNEGFDGKRCEDECFLECGIHGSCTTEINISTGIKEWKCLCRDNFTGFIDNDRKSIYDIICSNEFHLGDQCTQCENNYLQINDACEETCALAPCQDSYIRMIYALMIKLIYQVK